MKKCLSVLISSIILLSFVGCSNGSSSSSSPSLPHEVVSNSESDTISEVLLPNISSSSDQYVDSNSKNEFLEFVTLDKQNEPFKIYIDDYYSGMKLSWISTFEEPTNPTVQKTSANFSTGENILLTGEISVNYYSNPFIYFIPDSESVRKLPISAKDFIPSNNPMFEPKFRVAQLLDAIIPMINSTEIVEKLNSPSIRENQEKYSFNCQITITNSYSTDSSSVADDPSTLPYLLLLSIKST